MFKAKPKTAVNIVQNVPTRKKTTKATKTHNGIIILKRKGKTVLGKQKKTYIVGKLESGRVRFIEFFSNRKSAELNYGKKINLFKN